MPDLQIIHAGLIPYAEALAMQNELMARVIDEKLRLRDKPGDHHTATSNYLIFCEHPPVFTMGNRGTTNNLVWDQKQREGWGIEFFQTRRGGDMTYHGPGQLVVYPILDLDQFFTDIHKYLRLLEESVILTLAGFGISAGRMDGLTGVWVGAAQPDMAKKICAMGVRCSRWVTQHGLALNVTTNLSHFEGIVPCGIADYGVTSIFQETGQAPTLEEVASLFLTHFKTLFLPASEPNLHTNIGPGVRR